MKIASMSAHPQARGRRPDGRLHARAERQRRNLRRHHQPRQGIFTDYDVLGPIFVYNYPIWVLAGEPREVRRLSAPAGCPTGTTVAGGVEFFPTPGAPTNTCLGGTVIGCGAWRSPRRALPARARVRRRAVRRRRVAFAGTRAPLAPTVTRPVPRTARHTTRRRERTQAMAARTPTVSRCRARWAWRPSRLAFLLDLEPVAPK